ncbi:MAG: hypothetical protein ACYTEZ_01135 [Planctomycetota bacterium]
MLEWLEDRPELLWWAGALSLGTLAVSLLLIPVVIARMPHDYFVRRRPTSASWSGRHPLLRLAVLAGKNLLGLLVLLAGVAMLLGPGQGILTILIGLMLVGFPGKRRLELRLIRLRGVRGAVDWMRARAHRPPLQLPPPPRRARESP